MQWMRLEGTMTRYSYFYAFSYDEKLLEDVVENFTDMLEQKGVALKGPDKMRPADGFVVERWMRGGDPKDKMHNWLHRLNRADVEGLPGALRELHCWTFRVESGIEAIESAYVETNISQDVVVALRFRVAGFKSDNPLFSGQTPFSYNPEDDYYTNQSDDHNVPQ